MAVDKPDEGFSPFDFLEKKAKDFGDLLSKFPDLVSKFGDELSRTDIGQTLSKAGDYVEKTGSEALVSVEKTGLEVLASTQKFMRETGDKISKILDFQDKSKLALAGTPT